MFKSFKKKVIMGMIILAPIAVTLYVFAFMIKVIARLTAPMVPFLLKVPFLERWPSGATYALSFLTAIILLWLLGTAASNIFGRTILLFAEKVFLRAPVINRIYVIIKQIVHAMASERSAFRKVVRIDYPRKGVKTLAFVTGETVIGGVRHYSLFVPTTPNPTSGFFCMIPVSEVEDAGFGTEVAMKIIASGGMIR
ncbi:MAG: DUF502 domain-containing protein [Candidatus Omnitrophota bacterium]|nr:DUF502 domain-containing protein [Candidatus Omnitrophota bacterium]MBU2528258.1 DUF502 domain-containing protein [bacterium]MBU3929635.1 DUF502 domain-containing protein [bacterium]MBU4122119.1 DUF502 domain-containing protein [bacterium]